MRIIASDYQKMKRIPIYKRVVLEISGEMLKGASNNATNCPIDFEVLDDLAKELIAVRNHGVELGVVVGGGNIWRGASNHEIEPATSHQIGMLATVMNALAFRALLEKHGVNSYIASTLGITSVVEACNHHQVITRLARNEIVIFAGGTGQPFFTTDTGAALWALKIKANVILKATKVDGVYTKDPAKYKNAKKFKKLKFMDVLKKGLKVMDATAVSLCMDNNLPIIVFNLGKTGNIKRVVLGDEVGTYIS